MAYGALRVPRKVKQARFGVRARFQSHQQSATQREAEDAQVATLKPSGATERRHLQRTGKRGRAQVFAAAVDVPLQLG
ncbi:hypothetical protein D3C80_1970410 [compost metagenome]